MIDKGIITYANPKFLHQLGYSDINEVKHKKIFDFIAPEYKDIAMQRMQNIYKTESAAISIEEIFIKKDGSFINVMILGRLINYESKKLIQGYIYDISEIKLAAELNILFKNLFESAPDSLLILNNEGIIQNINNQFMKEIELNDKSMIIGKNFTDFCKNINWKIIFSRLASTDKQECNGIIKSENIAKKNHWLKIVRIKDIKDKIIVFSRNIDENLNHKNQIEKQNTKLEKINSELKYSETNYKKIFNAVNECILLLNIDTRKINQANESFLKLFGYKMSEILDLNLTDLFETREELASNKLVNIGEYFQKTENQNYLALGRKKDGTKIWISLYIKYIEINHKIHLLVLLNNIDLLEKSKSALKRSKTIFKELSELSQAGIFLFNNSGFIYTNPATSTITGYTSDELKTITIENLIHPDSLSYFKKNNIISTQIKNKTTNFQLKLISKDKSIKWIDYSATKIDSIENNAAIGNFVDISQNKAHEKKLIAARKKAEESDELKSAFLANMSHEIRTPMNGVLGFVQLLKESSDPERNNKFLNIIESSAKQLLNIINDILDLSKIEAGQEKIKYSEINISQVFENIFELFKIQITSKNNEVNLILENNQTNDIIISDEKHLIQILNNLIGNALKFTEKGEISFGYKKKKNTFIFYVKDTGLGIPEDKKNLVFIRFAQIHTYTKTTARGTGLGLPITKKLVEMLGGSIYFESKENIGTTFFVELPTKHKKIINT